MHDHGAQGSPSARSEDFHRDGFVVCRELFTAEECGELLSEVVAGWGSYPSSYLHAARFRRHQPLEMSSVVRSAVCRLAHEGESVLGAFLGPSTALAELSSITVFPGAEAQVIHHDEFVEGKRLISIFVNLAPTTKEAGALIVCPGSHAPPLPNERGEPVSVELPAGSAVFMNGKLRHGGGANTAADRFRPVFYASFGDLDIAGPVYSIRDDHRARYTLDNFLPRAFADDEVVTIPPEVTAFRHLDGSGNLAVSRRTSTTGSGRLVETIEGDEDVALLFERLSRGQISVGQLASETQSAVEEIREFLNSLWLAGLIAVVPRG